MRLRQRQFVLLLIMLAGLVTSFSAPGIYTKERAWRATPLAPRLRQPSLAPPSTPPPAAHPAVTPIWSAQIGWMRVPGQGWHYADFVHLAGAGINQVEINLDWGAIEPSRGHFDFRRLDRYLADAAAARLRLVLIFWESVWDGPGMNPPAWLPQRDRTSDGLATAYPPWWDADAMRAYFHYIATTLDHVNASPGFGGLFVSYGWLDAEWGPAPKGSQGVAGYDPADIAEFHRWLPRQYASLEAFNRHWHTSFTAWDQVPAPLPGSAMFPLYQSFRLYSVATVYDALSRLARGHSRAPLYYYWGGGLGGAGGISVLGNDPDMFFRLARRYRATIVLDDADHAGLALLFGDMAEAYDVPLMEEWTPRNQGLLAEAAAWLAHYGLGLPRIQGEDFFLYQAQRPGREFVRAWPLFTAAHAALAALHGRAPRLNIALLVPTSELGRSQQLAPAPGLAAALGMFWRTHLVLPAVITDSELQHGIVNASNYSQIFKINSAGSPNDVLNQALPLLDPYAALNPVSADLTIVPVVSGDAIWVLIANRGATAYSGQLSLALPTLVLSARSYAAELSFPAPPPESFQLQPSSSGSVAWKIALPSGGLQIWHLTPP